MQAVPYNHEQDELSDDEIFIGKLSLKELKKHILWNNHSNNHSTNVSWNRNNFKRENDDSFKLIETHSTPNLRSNNDKNIELNTPDHNIRSSDDSFVRIENMVSNLCISSSNCEKTEELNNTLEVIDYILNNGQNHKTQVKKEYIENCEDTQCNPNTVLKSEIKEIPCQLEVKEAISFPEGYITPTKPDKKPIPILHTPSGNNKPKLAEFKTPANPVSHKKPLPTSIKKTPSRANAYQHIASPIASYIKNCPQVPLLKDVHPRKPLPGPSSIPKFVKTVQTKKEKENINLPSIAYRNAKKTKVINLPDDEKMPQSPWAKKITSTLPKPLIMKHDHREVNSAKKALPAQTEDSFANLSYRQAEVSVCTQKTAFSTKNRL